MARTVAGDARKRGTLAEYNRKRDFSRTREPAGREARSSRAGRRGTLRFVIQKHAATRLHYDLRLELDGVMKSWAVPKGPSLDPSQKRLAVEVEDHPIAYNAFEGTIPAGEYGGGTVMLWDRGTYEADTGGAEALRRGYERGEIKFTLHGERLRGSFTLVRLRGRGEAKPQWLLIKHRDAFADRGWDIDTEDTSIETGRTMDEISARSTKQWTRASGLGTRDGAARDNAARDNGTRDNGARRSATSARRASSAARRVPKRVANPEGRAPSAASLLPMMASIGTAVPEGAGWTFEPKYDGVRVLVFASGKGVRLVTRNGKDKSKPFPEVVRAVRALATRRKRPFVLDGEIVALAKDAPARFQALQSRMHLQGATDIAEQAETAPAALIAFDLLADGDDVLIAEPWTTRRRRLERLIGKRADHGLRLGDSHSGSGEKLLARARRDDWEGIIAKRVDSTYQPGTRSRDWLKLKVEFRQEFVVGGYTEPRKSREHLGAMLLGYFDGDRLVYVGHTGGGFTRQGLADMAKRLERLERKSSPFDPPPRTNEPAHWVRPEVVVEVKFNEWTADGRLRQPIFLGVRDDKEAREVTKEGSSVQRAGRTKSPGSRRGPRDSQGSGRVETRGRRPVASRGERTAPARPRTAGLLPELERAENERRDAHVTLPGRIALTLTSLEKVWFPGRAGGYTKGDVLRYYAANARFVLPVMADRPLVLKRYPNGITGEAFYQQKAPEHPPSGARVETIDDADGDRVERLVGGSLATLLYQVQLGTISIDPWHSRVQSLRHADYSIIDLDPGPRAPFERVVEVALFVKEELDRLGLRAAIKTSGASGLHICLPLPPRTTYESALLTAQVIATRVASAHPREATVERTVRERPRGTVYVDYLQNVLGKSVAAAYAVRARPGATVSTPLRWNELTPELDPRDFTIESAPVRFAKLGDIWTPALKTRNTKATLASLAAR